jgi:hypothetical protein
MTPFDFVKLLHDKQVKWENLTEEDQKSWNTYIVNKALSFDSNYLDIVSKIQPYTGGQLTSATIFRYYQYMLPNRYKYNKWIKNNKVKGFNTELLLAISDYYECSISQVEEYLGFLDKKEIKSTLVTLGYQEDQIKKLLK